MRTLILFFLLGLAGTLSADPLLNPSFTFTAQTFEPLVAAVPEPYRDEILAHPKEFLEDYLPLLSLPNDLLVLVDKQHELPSDYAADDLVELRWPRFAVNRKGLLFRKAYEPKLAALIAASKKAGVQLTIASTYRSWDYQKNLFQAYANKDGLATAERYSARPGRSQHQLGSTLDFGSVTPEFAQTRAGRWVNEHAEEYGFSLSYPQGKEDLTGYIWEPWHFRYMGKAACAVQKRWFGDLQQELLLFNNSQGDLLRAALKKAP